MQATIERQSETGIASRKFSVALIRSAGHADQRFGCPAILIILADGTSGWFEGEFEAHAENGLTARIGECLYGKDLLL